MKVSILLTSYNLVDYIDASINSVIQMDMPFEWELLIGDDGSSDGTVEKIEAWIEKYPENIKLFQIPRDRETSKTGSRAAINRAYLLEQATGDYLNYLDGDDCFLGTDKIRKQIEWLEDPKNADCSGCAHPILAYYIKEDRRVLFESPRISRKYTAKQYWPFTYFHTNTLMFRSKCKKKLLDPLCRGYLNDSFITYLVLQCGKLLFMPETWAQYNITGEGLWTGHSRMYGVFRGMKYMDLQLFLNPEMKRQILIRYQSELGFVTREYNASYYDEIKPLLENLDPKIFKNTLLLSKTVGLTSSEATQKKRLKTIAYIGHKMFRGHRIVLKLKRLVGMY